MAARARLRAADSCAVLALWHAALSAWRLASEWLSPGVMWSMSVARPVQPGACVVAWQVWWSRVSTCWRMVGQLGGRRLCLSLVDHAIVLPWVGSSGGRAASWCVCGLVALPDEVCVVVAVAASPGFEPGLSRVTAACTACCASGHG